jgi:hypothetical protein
MKTLKLFTITIASFIMMTACEKYLDIEPKQEVSEDLSFENEANVKTVLIGAYALMHNANLFGGLTMTSAELLGGDGDIFFWGTYGGMSDIMRKQMISSNENARATWIAAYRTIYTANKILNSLDVVNSGKEQVEGEAKFLRALIYFELVRFYSYSPYIPGQANSQLSVPLMLDPEDDMRTPRATVDAVYGQIVEDLIRAANILPAISGENYYATAGAANALLAKVYLQMGNFPEALTRAHNVINSGDYSLTSSFPAAFNNTVLSSEDIFVAKLTGQSPVASSMNEFWSSNSRRDIAVLDDFYNLFDDSDIRKTMYTTMAGRRLSTKWDEKYGVINIIRLAEMHLIRAECNQRLGSVLGDTPLNDINRLCARSGLGTVDNPYYSTVTLSDILLQRRLELAHEGHKIHDHRRLQLPVGTFVWNAPELCFPIPEREVQAYLPSILEQNQGY